MESPAAKATGSAPAVAGVRLSTATSPPSPPLTNVQTLVPVVFWYSVPLSWEEPRIMLELLSQARLWSSLLPSALPVTFSPTRLDQVLVAPGAADGLVRE